jgi:citrate/tricarballylate utilization protein
VDGRLWIATMRDVAVLRHLGGGGGGCYHPDPERPSRARRVLHQLVLAGFLLAFAATLVAAVEQDFLGLPAPYPVLSAPVLLGTAGGLGLVAGASGLLWLRARVPAGAPAPAVGRALDMTFLLMIQAVAGTGLLLLGLRETPAMGTLLVVHLAAVTGLFVTAPYGKLTHAPLRLAALLQDRVRASRWGR